MARDFTSYLRQLIGLLPRGKAWNASNGTVMNQLLTGKAVELARVDGRVDNLLVERDTRTASELLNEHEADFGIIGEKSYYNIVGDATFTRTGIAWKHDGTQVADGVPRYEADRNGNNNSSIFIEEASSNVLLYSSDFSNVNWLKFGGLTVSQGKPDPFGGMNAAYCTSGTGPVHTIAQLVNGSPLQSYHPSFWIKKELNITNINGSIQIYNYSSGASGTWDIDYTKLSIGWNRIVYTHPSVTVLYKFKYTAGGQGGIQILLSTDVIPGFYIFGAQVEDGKTYATSYIPTTTIAVTRNVESLSFPIVDIAKTSGGAITGWFNNSSFPMDTHRCLFSIPYPAEGSQNMYLYFDELSIPRAYLMYRFAQNGFFSVHYDHGGILSTGDHHFAIVWDTYNLKMYFDGELKAAALNRKYLPTFVFTSSVIIGSVNNSYFFNGTVDDIKFFNRSLSDSDVLALYNGTDVVPSFTFNEPIDYHFDNNFANSANSYETSDSVAKRQAAIHTQLIALGGLTKAYYIYLAAALGYVIDIEEETPAWTGIATAGQPCGDQSIIFKWIVTFKYSNIVHQFSTDFNTAFAMQSNYTSYADLVALINKYKPAHTQVFFQQRGPEFNVSFSVDFNSGPTGFTAGAYSIAFDTRNFDAYTFKNNSR